MNNLWQTSINLPTPCSIIVRVLILATIPDLDWIQSTPSHYRAFFFVATIRYNKEQNSLGGHLSEDVSTKAFCLVSDTKQASNENVCWNKSNVNLDFCSYHRWQNGSVHLLPQKEVVLPPHETRWHVFRRYTTARRYTNWVTPRPPYSRTPAWPAWLSTPNDCKP